MCVHFDPKGEEIQFLLIAKITSPEYVKNQLKSKPEKGVERGVCFCDRSGFKMLGGTCRLCNFFKVHLWRSFFFWVIV